MASVIPLELGIDFEEGLQPKIGSGGIASSQASFAQSLSTTMQFEGQTLPRTKRKSCSVTHIGDTAFDVDVDVDVEIRSAISGSCHLMVGKT